MFSGFIFAELRIESSIHPYLCWPVFFNFQTEGFITSKALDGAMLIAQVLHAQGKSIIDPFDDGVFLIFLILDSNRLINCIYLINLM